MELEERCRYRLDDLCAAYGKSRRQVQRHFRATLGCTPLAFLREERLQAAYRLLRSSLSVQVVACRLGFRQESQFSRAFRARFGVSPSTVQALPPVAGSERVHDEADRPSLYWEPVPVRLEFLRSGRGSVTGATGVI